MKWPKWSLQFRNSELWDFDSDSDANQISFRNCFAIIYLGLEWKSNWTRSLALCLSTSRFYCLFTYIFSSEAKNGASGKNFMWYKPMRNWFGRVGFKVFRVQLAFYLCAIALSAMQLKAKQSLVPYLTLHVIQCYFTVRFSHFKL